MSQIVDGASQTVLVGEKWMMPRFYNGVCDATGSNPSQGNGGDNNSMYQGYDPDNARKGAPVQDYEVDGNDWTSGGAWTSFGSPHPGGANISFCDGSVRTIAYDDEDIVWGELIKRNDRDAI